MKDTFYSYKRLYKNTIFSIVIWTLIIGGSLAWNIYNELNDTRDSARKEARTNFDKDQSLRLWATAHGGVYVPPDEKTSPNPYLEHVTDRDTITPSGKKLTLMNPAYMLRQIMEYNSELYGIKGSITSLKLLNPINNPDPWEQKALQAFEQGIKEVSAFTEINGKPFLRLMRPMITQEGCLKCHGYQKYRVGDVRGGVSISVPMAPYWSMARKSTQVLTHTHGVIFFLGLLSIGFFTWRTKVRLAELIKTEKELAQYREHLEDLVGSRTKKLSEANKKLQSAISKIKTLSGLLPICSSCKKIRDDQGYWEQIETYVRDHSEADFTHSIRNV